MRAIEYRRLQRQYGLSDRCRHAQLDHGYRRLSQGYINLYDANAVNKLAGYLLVDNGVDEQFSLDHRLRVNAAGYCARTTSLQVTAAVTSPVTGLITSLPFNAGTLEVHGLEIESSFSITRDFSLFANPSFMRGEYSYIVPTTTAISINTKPVRLPDLQFSGGGNYMRPVAAIGGSVAYRHNSPYFVAILNTTKTQTEDFVDAAINFRTSDQKIGLSFEVSNLTQQKAATANLPPLFPGDPRRFTGRVSFKF